MKQFKLFIFFASLVLLCGCNKILYGEHTLYSPGYSEERFQKVRTGMTVSDVTNLLGNPLCIFTQQWKEVWYYGPVQAEALHKTTDFTYQIQNVTELTFNERRTVISMTGDYLKCDLIGIDSLQVENIVGPPNRKVVTPFSRIFQYSKASSRGSGTYKRREVWIGSSNTVSQTIKIMYFD